MGNTNHFEFSGKLRRLFIGLIAGGLVAIALGFIFNGSIGMHRVWANFLLNTMFFLGMGLMGLFFVATHTMAYGGWQTLVQRIPEAISTYIPVGVLFLGIIVGATLLNGHHLYHWTDTFIAQDTVTVGELRNYEANMHHGDDHHGDEHGDEHHGDEHTYLNDGTTVLAAQTQSLEDIKHAAETAGSTIHNTAQQGVDQATDAVQDAADGIHNAAEHAGDALHDAAHDAADAVHDVLGNEAHGDGDEHGHDAEHHADGHGAHGDGHTDGDHSGDGHDGEHHSEHHGDAHANGGHHNDSHDAHADEHHGDQGHGEGHYEYYWGKVSAQGDEHGHHASTHAAEYDGMADEAVIANPHFDVLIAHKTPYLNKTFWGLRFLAYAALWIFFATQMRKLSLRQDKEGGIALYKKHKVLSGAFMVVAGVTTSTMAWDFLMSIDSHWFSTMYGWYTTVSLWVATVATTVLILIYLKGQGYLPQVNENHLHDLGKYLFGFSVFWTYLWFSQYMLIWYANLPEETMYFHARNGDPVYKTLFFVNLGLNFFVPFGILLTRGAKRRVALMTFMAASLVFSHWLDIFLGIMPGTVGDGWALGLLEFGMFAAFGGIFLLVVFTSLSRASLIPQKHPFYLESVTHET